MEHYVFLLINIVILGIVLYTDKDSIKDYLWLFSFGLLFAFIFETVTTYLGFWQYNSMPKIPLISLYTWLLYVPYISLCYFLGRSVKDVK